MALSLCFRMEESRGRARWRCVRERLGFLSCCGSSRHWSNNDRAPPVEEELQHRMAAQKTEERVSLMRLLEEEEREEEEEGVGGGCCVCMGRRRGAAFIPCGHTFCRVCARELWLGRRSCPLCNRPVVKILDIY